MGSREGALHFELACTLHEQGRLDEAIASYRQALELSPNHTDALNNLGAALLQQGKLQQAAEAFERACELDDKSALARTNLGNVRQLEGRLSDALREFRRALAIDPSFVDAHYNLGNALGVEASWEEAASSYRRALELDPLHVQSHFNLANALHQQGLLDEAVAAYRDAVTQNPDYVDALSNLGTVLRELNRAGEAAECYRKALALRPGHPELEQNLRAALSRQIPRWHFPMLADQQRNEAYRQALEKVVVKGSRVLDIGTGSGLLAMMAARAGAACVTACEMSSVVADAARAVVADNGFSETIAIVGKKSTALRVGEDLARPANVLVSEIVDVGLLGEGVLPSLRHAWRHLLTPDAVVIPSGATVFARLVELPRLRPVNPVRDISGLDLSAFDRFRVPNDYLDIKLEHESHRFLSEEFRVASFDFGKVPPFIAEMSPDERVVEVTVAAAGTIHAVAFWFELRLDEELALSTRPGDASTAWGQAVQFFDRDTPARAGEPLTLTVRVSDTRIGFRLAGIEVRE